MTLSPTDRTSLNALTPNLAPNQVALSALRLTVFQEIYTYLDSIINDLNAAQSAGSVTSAKLADGSVITVKIADGNVTSAKIADGAIVTLKLSDGSVTTVKLADLAVTTAKLANFAVTSSKIAPGAVGATQLDPTLLSNFGDIAVQAEFDRRGINVMKYGAKGDGVTDDTTAIQAAVDACVAAGGGTVLFPKGTYIHGNEITVSNLNNFAIIGDNATLKSANGTPVATLYAGIKLTNCSNFSIKNLIIDGNRANRTPAETATHLLYVLNCRDFVIDQVQTINGTTDGMFVSATIYTDDTTYSKHGKITNCVSNNNYRQGLTIGNAIDLTIEHSYFTNTNGTAPQAGVDIEPNAGYVTEINFSRCTFTDNVGAGLICSDELTQLVVDNCIFRDNVDASIDLAACTDVEIKNNTFNDGTVASTKELLYIRTGSKRINVVGNSFNNNTVNNEVFRADDGASHVIFERNIVFNSSHGVLFSSSESICANNIFDTINGIAISNTTLTTNTKILHNVIKGSVGRAIFDAGVNTLIEGNIIKGVTSVSGGLIQQAATSPGDVINNYVEQTPVNTGNVGIRLDNKPKKVTGNKIVGCTPAGFSFQNGSIDTFYAFNTVDGNGPHEINKFKLGGKVHTFGTAAPSTGTWAVGDIVYNTAPIAGGKIGWTCITAGTPGTWKPFGAIDA